MRLRHREEGEDFWPAYADILMVTTLLMTFVVGALIVTYNADDIVRKEIRRRQAVIHKAFVTRMGPEIKTGALSIEASGEQQKLTFSDTGSISLLFEKGSDRLNPQGLAIMEKVARVLRENASKTYQSVQVNGHTDIDDIHTVQFPSNWHLSSARATTVVAYLAGKGIRNEALSATGFSEFQPIAQGGSAAAMAKNRRIEMVLLYPEWYIKGLPKP